MIIGIDPGINKTDVVFVNETTGTLCSHFSIRVPKDTIKGREEMAGRTKPQYIFDEMTYQLAIRDGWRNRKVYIEEPVAAGSKNIRTAIQMGRACGAIEAALDRLHMIPTLVPVSVWKKVVLGKGNVDKAYIKDWVETQHPSVFAEIGDNQDLCDAYCIARYGLTQEVEGGPVRQDPNETYRSTVGKRLPGAGHPVLGGSKRSTDLGGSKPL